MDIIYVIHFLLAIIVGNGLVIFLFFKINGLKFSFKTILLAYLLRLPLSFLISVLDNFLPIKLFYYLDEPLYGLLLSIIFLRPLPKMLLIFYGLFPLTLWSTFYHFIYFFILPLLGNTNNALLTIFLILSSHFVSIIFILIFLKWLKYDFTNLKTNFINIKDWRLLYLSNWTMIFYYFLIQLSDFLEKETKLVTLGYKQLVIVLNLIIFMGIIHRLDSYLRERLQEKVTFQQELQLQDMEKYSNHVEGLYREIRGFRHDYSNLLTTLHLGIEDNDMAQIKEIYESVLQDSSKQLKNHKYDIGRLINVSYAALKSLLAAKCIEASEKNISVIVEVPDPISLDSMTMVDFITIVSILFDNAVEASMMTDCPSIRLAFLKLDDKQLFILENSTKEESLVISELYEFGYSSKGKDRGVGLYNVMKLLERYPNASLNTTSKDYTFCQVLEIKL